MNLPIPCGAGTVGWFTFRLPTPRDIYSRHPETHKPQYKRQFRHDAEDWCMANVKGKWAEAKSQSSPIHTFQFKEKQDAMLFKLTWCLDTVKPEFNWR